MQALDSINTDGLELLSSVTTDRGADQPSISIHEVRSLGCSDLAYGQSILRSRFTSSSPPCLTVHLIAALNQRDLVTPTPLASAARPLPNDPAA